MGGNGKKNSYNSGADKVHRKPSDGDDTVDGDKGNDTLYGGTGKDIFRYYNGEGNDVIADFEVGDSIQVYHNTVSSASLSGSDMIFKIGSNTLTVKGGKDKDIAIGNYIYHNNLMYNAKKTSVSLGAGFSGTLKSSDYESTVKEIYAGNVTKAVVIPFGGNVVTVTGGTGNDYIYSTGSKNEVIYGGAGNDKLWGYPGNDTLYGGTGNDTLYGGAGNDVLTGNAGKDVFCYDNGGNDTITDYTAGDDTIRFSVAITKTTVSGSDVIFTTASGNLTVKNGKGKKITVTNSSGSTSTQTYSKTLDLLYDNNFITDETNLDAITEKKYAVTQIQPQNENELEEAVITYAKEE